MFSREVFILAKLHRALVTADDDVVVGAADDLAEVPADVGAVLLEDGALGAEALGRAVEVRVVGVLGRDAQSNSRSSSGCRRRVLVKYYYY